MRSERESLAERLERERLEGERAYRERRARIERERAEREHAYYESLERRRRQHSERLRRERDELRRRGQLPSAPSASSQNTTVSRPQAGPAPVRVPPRVEGPVRKRARAAENRQRAASRRTGLFWPTAKAGLAVSAAIALGAGLGSLLGLPIPGLDQGSSAQTLAATAPFGVDAGTVPGLSAGYVFPIQGPHDFGQKDARFGASRYGHIHEGQDIFGKLGTPEVAVTDGVVVDEEAENGRFSGGRGNYEVIYSPEDDRSFVYMHQLKPPELRIGDQVHAGQVIGLLGCSGSCDGPHLHFEIRIGKASLRSDTKPVDPLPYLRQWPQPVPG